MTKQIEYRELSGFKEFEGCYNLQKEVFGLSDKDALPPVFLNLLTRKYPRTGFAVGAFIKKKNKDILIGFILCVAEIEYDTIYGIIVGINLEFRKSKVGLGLFIALRKLVISLKIKHFHGIYEPLEGNLANLYFNRLGFKATKYEPEAYELSGNNFPIDKVLIKWDMDSERVKQKIEGTYKKENLDDVLTKYPIATTKKVEQSDKILIQIPEDFIKLKQQNEQKALEWRMETRKLFTEYINNRNYTITEFYTRIINDNRENYYLLEKTNISP